MLELIFTLIVLGVLLWALEQLPLDATVKRVIRVVVIVLIVLWAARALLQMAGGPLATWPFPVR
jgi:hypothetical protein